MSDRIDPEVIEVVACLIYEEQMIDGHAYWGERLPLEYRRRWLSLAESAIRAADQARGLKEERSVMAGYMRSERYVLAEGEEPPALDEIEVRYVSDWRPVERPS
jgi:hypothetical protein